MWGLYQTEKKLTVIQKLSWRFSRSIVPTLNTQDLRELVKKNLWRCPKKVIPVQNCMENPFFGVSRPYKGLLETYPNTCWKGLISKCSAKVPQNRKKEYCSFQTSSIQFLSFLGPIWGCLGSLSPIISTPYPCPGTPVFVSQGDGGNKCIRPFFGRLFN